MHEEPQAPRPPSELEKRRELLSSATVLALEELKQYKGKLSADDWGMVMAAFDDVKFRGIQGLSDKVILEIPENSAGTFDTRDAKEVVAIKLLAYLARTAASEAQIKNIIQTCTSIFGDLSRELNGAAIAEARERLMKRPNL